MSDLKGSRTASPERRDNASRRSSDSHSGRCHVVGDLVAKEHDEISYSGYRFPPEIIHQAIWLYLRFTLSLRDVEDLLAERGVAVSYETVRRWVNHFGPMIAACESVA